MTDTESTSEGLTTSRRTMLKGAVGAGVGLAAWSAPKIGTIPAYALTNSSGVFNGMAYYISFRSRDANGGTPERARWNFSNSTTPAAGLGRADSIVRIPPGDISPEALYTWLAIFPDGSDLQVRAVGDPRFAPATITIETAPAGCVFETSADTARRNGNYIADPPGTFNGTFTPTAAPRAGSGSYAPVGTAIQLSGVGQNSRNNVVHFNIRCN